MANLHLSITPLKPADVPLEDQILDAARELIKSTSTWKQGKTHCKGVVKGYSRPKGPNDGAPWFCRVSVHGVEDATFDEFWKYLGNDKAENEKQFIHNIDKVQLVKRISPTQSVWNIHYSFPPPISNRSFTVLQVVHLENDSPKRSGFVVSLPIDLTSDPTDAELAKLEERGTKGRYASVERLSEMEDGKVEWRMATSSTPGGSIPSFIADSSTPGKIAEDVPAFLKWLHSNKRTKVGNEDKPATLTGGETTVQHQGSEGVVAV